MPLFFNTVEDLLPPLPEKKETPIMARFYKVTVEISGNIITEVAANSAEKAMELGERNIIKQLNEMCDNAPNIIEDSLQADGNDFEDYDDDDNEDEDQDHDPEKDDYNELTDMGAIIDDERIEDEKT